MNPNTGARQHCRVSPPVAAGLVRRRPGPPAPSSTNRSVSTRARRAGPTLAAEHVCCRPPRSPDPSPPAPTTRSALVVTLQLGVAAGAVWLSKLVLRQVPTVYVFGDSRWTLGTTTTYRGRMPLGQTSPALTSLAPASPPEGWATATMPDHEHHVWGVSYASVGAGILDSTVSTTILKQPFWIMKGSASTFPVLPTDYFPFW
jgi:hypothetical protein